MAKYNQLESSRYENNEYPNMPSIDYWSSSYTIRETNYKTDCDWDKAKEICHKYGFDYKFIKSTFGGDDMDVVIYKKINFDQDEYIRLLKSNEKADIDAYCKLVKSHESTFLTLHDCLHELDEETNLYFDCGWNGNVGLFGSNDVRRNVYKFADSIYTYKNLTHQFSPLIHDTERKFCKGVYIYVTCSRFKIDETDRFPEFNTEMALKVMREYAPHLNFEVCMGRRACDGAEEYEAIVVTGNKGGQYGSFTINKDGHDVVKMSVRVPLAGEHTRWITPQGYVKTIQDSIEFMLHWCVKDMLK